MQRRDLSFPHSRIVVNYFDFNERFTAVQYSNDKSLPLNAAYLSTGKNIAGSDKRSRMSRTVKNLLQLVRQSGASDTTGLVADSFSTAWMPHALPFMAMYADGARVEGEDFFYNESVLIRQVRFNNRSGRYILKGNYEGRATISGHQLVIDNGHIRYAIAVNTPKQTFWIEKGQWMTTIDPATVKEEALTIAIAFADEKEATTALLAKATKALAKGAAAQARQKGEAYWNAFLQKVPHPINFQLGLPVASQTKAEDLKKAYYKSWVFTAQNVLPADPIHFPYPQVCTGKASLWDEGHEKAPFSAAWESFLGIQFYAYIDPATAWKAYKGLLTLVDEEGMLGGESLPSRKAQTAMVLYQLTGDKASLKEVYPALKRYLKWRLKITHWVYGAIRPSEHSKDAEFAFSALVDMEHMQEIARLLNQEEEVSYWQQEHTAFWKQCQDWFWVSPTQPPMQTYNTKSKAHSPGHTIWVTTGLYVNTPLKPDYLASFLNRFDKDYDPALPFAGFTLPKYPDLSYTVYGLLNRGEFAKATGVMQANLRDIVKTNAVFAEQYIGQDLQPDGVRPSLFGSSAIIDFCMLLNGYKYDRGKIEVLLPGNQAGGVTNIRMRNKTLSIKTDPVRGQVHIGGSLLPAQTLPIEKNTVKEIK